MNAKTTTFAFSCALTLVGSAMAADAGHDSYHRSLFGEGSSYISASQDTMGKLTGTSTGSAWSGHEAYTLAILGSSPVSPDSGALGKAAYGIRSSEDGGVAYRGAFRGD